MLYSRSLLTICFKYSGVYVSVPTANLSLPQPQTPALVTIRLFSKSVNLFLSSLRTLYWNLQHLCLAQGWPSISHLVNVTEVFALPFFFFLTIYYHKRQSKKWKLGVKLRPEFVFRIQTFPTLWPYVFAGPVGDLGFSFWQCEIVMATSSWF